jgi:SAM-dependent methyltransferase
MSITEPVDLAAIKRGQQAMWASGDFGVIASLIHIVAELVADSVDLAAGSRVLDVAGGTGNAAIAAARCGCDVTCTDYVPALLERGRERAQAERLDIRFELADAEALPYEDGAFDAVLSVFGSMFAPDQARAAGELVRVCRPGGRIGLVSWTPEGFLGEWFSAPPPRTCPRPRAWPRRCAGARRTASTSCSATRSACSSCAGGRSRGGLPTPPRSWPHSASGTGRP